MLSVGYRPSYLIIKRTFKYYFQGHEKYRKLSKYEDQIIILSVFLFISSSFLVTKPKKNEVDFVKKPYKWIYDRNIMEGFVDCAVRYLWDTDVIDESIDDEIIYEGGGFNCQYRKKILSPYKLNIDLDKYEIMLKLVLRIHSLYKKEIPFQSKKVLDLVNCLSKWKQLAFDLFKYRAEYILFSFLVNLSR